MVRSLFNILLLTIAIGAAAQTAVSVQQEAVQLKNKLLKHHVTSRPTDDSFSEDVFDVFIKLLDPDKMYFTKQDLDELSVYKYKIDDELDGKSWHFLNKISPLFKKKLEIAEKIIATNTAEHFDFTKGESYSSNPEHAGNESELINRWRLHLKFETLNELLIIKKAQRDISDENILAKKESEARLAVRKANMRTIKRILDRPSGYEDYVASLFLRAIGLAFDPHSTHFSFSEMQDYITSLSTEGFYFGITIDENERGEIVIDELTPGGPAWKSGSVHSGDVIHKVRWGSNEWIEVDGMSRAEINELLVESHEVVMDFVLIQAGGIQTTVSLKKEKMESDENVVKSFILDGHKRIGYISLPGFYSAWGDAESSRCANDVAKEILKLKKENIDGLILDVRYNRGGSLYEAVAMGGIFIDAGPMGLLKDKTGLVTSVKDMNRGTVYDGPLVLMVNGLSASASEFLAAALQDYNRAIIVGSNTYGKATGQKIIPMQPGKDDVDGTLDMKSGWGFSTITLMKIYRITGRTAQKNGVTPDIRLPDLYTHSRLGEAYAAGALPADSVIKKTYYTPMKVLPLQELREKSSERVATSEVFQLTDSCSRRLVAIEERLDTISLDWVSYKEILEKEAEAFERLHQLSSEPTSAYKITAHEFNRQRMQVDEFIRQQNETWNKNLLRDQSLEEAFYIICDYIAAGSAN